MILLKVQKPDGDHGGSPHYAYVSRYCGRVACAVLLTQMNILWFLGNYGKNPALSPNPYLEDQYFLPVCHASLRRA